MSKTTTTPKGTTLPLMNLKGKDYLQVAYRLVWFREEEPQSGIETTFLVLNEDYAVVQAKITRDGKLVATATKRETKKDFPDFIEKAETGAIGRALALLGYGTQFTLPDLDEGSRLADSPVETKPAAKSFTPKPAEAKIEFVSAVGKASETIVVKPTEAKPSAGFTKPTKKAEATPPVSAQTTPPATANGKGAWS